ncbi:hypothetical protein [Bacillus altitudinis]|uniref:hypothetical protein n=1 Tax=Bacillus altitudinis TaxID=293387 RepID=UPI003016C534
MGIMLYIFKKTDNTSIKKIQSFFEDFNSMPKNKFEVKDVEHFSDFIRYTFVKYFDSYELFYDENTQNLETKKFSRMYSAQILILIKFNCIIIFGEKKVCLSAEKHISEISSNTLINWEFTFNQIYNHFSELEMTISEVTFSNINLLDTSLNAITLEFQNNFDALKIINKFKKNPISMIFKVFYQKEMCELIINFNSGQIELNYEIFSRVELENLEGKILNLIEGE